MNQDAYQVSDAYLDEVDTAYDPLMDFEGEDGEDGGDPSGQLGPGADSQAPLYAAPTVDNRTAEERIADLFASFNQRRRILLGILGFLEEPKHADDLQVKVNELQMYDHSVYSGYNYSLLLHEAGAIDKLNDDGTPFDEEFEQLPDIVEMDGVKFYKPTDGKQVYWVITPEGRAYVEADNPFGRLAELLEDQSKYREVYQDVLEYCANEQGRTADELTARVDAHEVVKSPMRHFSHFAHNLEECSAMVWEGKWKTTDLGLRALDQLFPKAGDRACQATSAEGE